MEYVSPEGLRLDGRRSDETRRFACQIGVLQDADGSAIVEMGNTKVGFPPLFCGSPSSCRRAGVVLCRTADAP